MIEWLKFKRLLTVAVIVFLLSISAGEDRLPFEVYAILVFVVFISNDALSIKKTLHDLTTQRDEDTAP